MKTVYVLLKVLLVCIILASCKSEVKQGLKSTEFSQISKGSTIVADSVLYDVIIRAMDKDDNWENERLKSLNQELFINYIFDNLYKEKLFAFDYITGERLSIKDIKKLEKSEGFLRSRISKIEFNEQWSIDSLGTLNKRINEMSFGIESYSSQGTFKGHLALFKVKANPNAR